MAEKSSLFKVRFDTSAQAYGDVNSTGLRKPFLNSLKPFAAYIICIIITSVLYSYTFVMTTRAVGTIIDIIVSSIVASVISGDSGISLTKTAPEIMKAALFIIANTISSLLQGILSSSVSTKYSNQIRIKTAESFSVLPLRFIDNHFHNEFYNTFTDGIDALNQSLNLLLGNYIPSLFVVIGIFIELYHIDFLIANIVLLITTLGIIGIYISSCFENQRASEQQKKSMAFYNNINELYNGIKIIQHSGKGASVINDLDKLSDSLNSSVKKARKVASVTSILTEGITAVALISVLITGAYRIHSSAISLGILITLIVYIRKLHQPFSQITTFPGVIKTIKFSLSAIFSILSEKKASTKKNLIPAIADDLEFHSISFSYNDVNNVLENVSFKIKSQGITAISGETGAGKSTIIKLILNFYSPNQGKIKMGKYDISDFEPESYKKLFSIIPQNAQLFECSIKENIAYGTDNATDEQIKEAAEKVSANLFIEKLENGYDTEYSCHEGNLSSGQIQLILLARALLQKNKYIIFDESTSFIDADAEMKLNQLLKKLSKECGIIIIAHRQTSIDIADNIIKISNGKTVY